MKVLYFHQFFNTPNEGGSLRSFYLCREMANCGYDVHVITSHTAIEKKQLTIEGIKVTYIPIKYDNSYKFWGRSIAYLKFSILAIVESFKHQSIDLCYVMTTPLTTGIIGIYNKFIHGRPFVFEVGDLWPLVPVEMGVIKVSWFSQLLFKFEKFCYQQSLGSIGLSPPITNYIRNISPNTPVETIYNISDCEYFKPEIPTDESRMKYGIKDEYVISYTGTFGMANDLSRMIDVISKLQHLPIKFLFIGMGAEKKAFEKKANSFHLKNCIILDFQKKEGMKEILTLSDAMFISFANYASLFTGSPNKLFDALAAGLLIITNFDGWIKDLIEKEECGFSFKHDSSIDFENKISIFLENDQKLRTAKQNARHLAETQFNLEIQAKKQTDFLESILD
ncbi:MAG: glycosyltransferase family 4 protein [Reichenbachiella sp.]